MTDIQPEPEEPLQNDDDSDCLNKNGIIEEHYNWCLCELCGLLAQVTSEHLTFLSPSRLRIWYLVQP